MGGGLLRCLECFVVPGRSQRTEFQQWAAPGARGKPLRTVASVSNAETARSSRYWPATHPKGHRVAGASPRSKRIKTESQYEK